MLVPKNIYSGHLALGPVRSTVGGNQRNCRVKPALSRVTSGKGCADTKCTLEASLARCQTWLCMAWSVKAGVLSDIASYRSCLSQLQAKLQVNLPTSFWAVGFPDGGIPYTPRFQKAGRQLVIMADLCGKCTRTVHKLYRNTLLKVERVDRPDALDNTTQNMFQHLSSNAL